MVQWLRLCAPNAGGMLFIPSQALGSIMPQDAARKKKKTYLVLVEFFPRGKGRPLAIDLKELGLRDMLSRSHQGSFFLSLPVQDSGLGLSKAQGKGGGCVRMNDRTRTLCPWWTLRVRFLSATVPVCLALSPCRECRKCPATGGTPCSSYLLC